MILLHIIKILICWCWKALKYEEEYELALESFSRAQALDPTWEAPQQKEKQLVKYLDSVQELVSLKGKLKGKKLQQMLQVRSGHVSSFFF